MSFLLHDLLEGQRPPQAHTSGVPGLRFACGRRRAHTWKDGFLPKSAYLEGRCRGVIRLEILLKAAYLEGACRGGVRLSFLPKAAYLEGRCQGVVRLGSCRNSHTLKDVVGGLLV